MTKIVVLFNLKDGADANAYENWAKQTDIPSVNALPSIANFEVFKTTGLLGGGESPYQYIEILDVADMNGLGADISSETMQKVAAEFQEFADNPIFITTDKLV